MIEASYRGMRLVVPDFDALHDGYFRAARAGTLVVQRCCACRLLRGTIGAACPHCSAVEWEWQEVSGRGTIHSYQVVTQAIQPGFADWVPYSVVLVTLDEQPAIPWPGAVLGEVVAVRKMANLVMATDHTVPEREENVAIGLRVAVCFVPLSSDMALPQFHLEQ